MIVDFVNKNNLLGFGNSNEEYFLNIGNISIKTNKEKLLTYYKTAFHERYIKEIGDKMTVFLNFDREEIILKSIDKNGFFAGTSIFQQYDEEKDEFTSYIYDFPKEEIDDLNDIIYALLREKFYLELKGNLVKIHQIYNSEKIIFNNLKNAIKIKDFGFIFSFLFGLVLAYGKFDIKEDALLAAKIHIPLVGNLINKQEKFDEIINFLIQNGIFVKTDVLNKKFGYVYQISITDWEILQNFAYFLKPIIGEIQNIKYQNMQYFKENIKNYVEKKGNIDNIYNYSGILKYLEK